MDINVFLLCYNESALLPHTVKHYKKYLPTCKITIYDNESTDNSVEIAKSLGCTVVSWNSKNIIDDFLYREIKNNCWKPITSGWIIMADMDEYVCVTEQELLEEKNNGTTLLRIIGKNMIGESKTTDLSDIDLQEIKKYNDYVLESKNLCFLREKIIEMNYELGAHNCEPKGTIIISSNEYINKHMNFLGLPFYINKMKQRFKRSKEMRKKRCAMHYTENLDEIKKRYIVALNESKTL